MDTRLMHKNQRGFSLVELVIVIALTGLISAAITTVTFQVFNMNTRTANRMAAVSQVQHAGKIVSEDILEAQPGNINDSPEGLDEFLILTLSAQNVTVTYTLNEYEGVLRRSEPISGGEPIVTRVAEYIDAADTYCDWNPTTGVLTFTVTATVGNGPQQAIETRIYEVKPRPGSS